MYKHTNVFFWGGCIAISRIEYKTTVFFCIRKNGLTVL